MTETESRLSDNMVLQFDEITVHIQNWEDSANLEVIAPGNETIVSLHYNYGEAGKPHGERWVEFQQDISAAIKDWKNE